MLKRTTVFILCALLTICAQSAALAETLEVNEPKIEDGKIKFSMIADNSYVSVVTALYDEGDLAAVKADAPFGEFDTQPNKNYTLKVFARNTDGDLETREFKNLTTPDDGRRETLIIYSAGDINMERLEQYIHDEIAGTAIKISGDSFDTIRIHPSQYDTIFLGYTIENNTLSPVIRSFLDTYDLGRATIAPFLVHYGGGDCDTYRLISMLEPNTLVLDGISVNGSEFEAEAVRGNVGIWLEDIGFDN